MTPTFLADVPRYLFLTGKGGVGKTSIACAAAITLAGQGRRVLLVSTDPASNVGQVFGLSIGNTITPVRAVPGLSALEIDPEQAAAAYRERIVGPVRGVLPDVEVRLIEEQLSGACTTEIASFNKFTGLLTDDALTAGYDHVIFDTAPTGHTIRLLQLPGSWTDFLNEGKGDASCLGPLAGLERQRGVYAEAVAALGDPARTRLVLVTRAQRAAVAEVERTHGELAALGLRRQHLVINAVMPTPDGDDDLARAIYAREQAVLADLPDVLRALPTDLLPLKGEDMVGISALGRLFAPDADTEPADGEDDAAGDVVLRADTLAALVDDLADQGHAVVMVMGKGGVGKTTIASAIAVALAERGLPVHLTTTDPAGHVDATLTRSLPTLEVSRIDPAVETARYRDHIMEGKGARLDEVGRAALAEDLRSPCTEEVAVFRAFSKIVLGARTGYVVIDTAPTGHTLLLLDATGSYHREVARQMGETAHFVTPMMRLQDPAYTKVLLVTLAEPTPVLEAAELQADLHRAGIRPWAWVINNSLAAASTTSPLLRRRARNERAEIDRVRTTHAERCAVVPLLPHEPVGIPALRALTAPALAAAPG